MAAAFLLVPALPASAHIQDFEVVEAAEFGGDGNWDQVSGDITCTAGETFRVTAKLVDSPSYSGKGYTTGTCTGSSQQWSVTLTNESGTGDVACPLSLNGRAHTKIDGEQHDAASHRALNC